MLFAPVKPIHFLVSETTAAAKADSVVIVVDESQITNKTISCKSLIEFDKSYLGGSLAVLALTGDFEGKWLQSQSLFSAAANKRIFVLGFGKKATERLARSRQLGIRLAEEIGKTKANSPVLFSTSSFLSEPESLAQLALGFSLGVYKFPKSNISKETKAEIEIPLKLEFIPSSTSVNQEQLRVHLAKVATLSNSQNLMRLLQDTPPNIATPEFVAKKGKEAVEKNGVKSEIFNAQKLRELNFNAMLAVGGGSANEPQLLVMDYNPPGAKHTIALVGKGLTMDTGGYSLKVPSTSQVGMKYDMSGAALVIAAVDAISALKLPVRVIGVTPLCENMVDAHAYRVGDVLTGYSGKTIEVLNTDAEGRVVLSDALAYTVATYKPEALFEFSTLTGAMITSLGHFAAGTFFANTDKLQGVVKDASEATGEKTWHLPIFDEMEDEIKGTYGDIVNISNTPGSAGSIAAAAFLREFVSDTPFVHFDIAGVADGAQAIGYPKKISSGYGVNLVVKIAEFFAK